jgi:hypothetical protein
VNDPATEPIPDLPPLPAPKPALTASLDRTRFQFMSGIPSGETAYIRGDDGIAVLSYRSFASVVGVMAALMSAIVLAAGTAGMLFLLWEHRPFPAIAALMLSAAFSAMIVMLVPATNVTIFDGGAPAITIAQQSSVSLPRVTYVVGDSDGKPIARIARSFFSRFGRNRWTILDIDNAAPRGMAIEESLAHALVRKILGKFAPAYQSNVRITWNGQEAGWIIRRPGADAVAGVGRVDSADRNDRHRDPSTDRGQPIQADRWVGVRLGGRRPDRASADIGRTEYLAGPRLFDSRR